MWRQVKERGASSNKDADEASRGIPGDKGHRDEEEMTSGGKILRVLIMKKFRSKTD